jgi:hypothetical protein
MQDALFALALSLAHALGYAHPPVDTLRAASAVVAASPGALQRPDDETLALVVYWMHRESAFRNDAIGDGGKARGVLQLHGGCGLRSVRDQVACWLAIVHQGEQICPASPLAITWGRCSYAPLADKRVARARELLDKVRALP